jgi:DNA-directed RNA polymerase specialized sigma24 family protein
MDTARAEYLAALLAAQAAGCSAPELAGALEISRARVYVLLSDARKAAGAA